MVPQACQTEAHGMQSKKIKISQKSAMPVHWQLFEQMPCSIN